MTTSFSPFQRAAEVVDPPRNPDSTTAWWRWWCNLRQGFAVSAVGEDGGGERLGFGREGVAGALAREPPMMVRPRVWLPPPSPPHYIGGTPRVCPKSSNKTPIQKLPYGRNLEGQGLSPSPFAWPAKEVESTMDSTLPLGWQVRVGGVQPGLHLPW